MSVVSNMTKSYTTFAGVDITAMFDNLTVHTIQGIAISVTREKVPVYRMGSSRPLSVSRGKRGIAGTLQFVLFDRDALHNLMIDTDHYFYAHSDEINWLNDTINDLNPYVLDGSQTVQQQADDFNANPNNAPWIARHGPRTVNDQRTANVIGGTVSDSPGGANVGARSQKAMAQYMDQIYPFDVTMVGQNEYGNGSWSSILGMEIINEGGGISMDDLTSETTSTYIAIHRTPWEPISSQGQSLPSYSQGIPTGADFPRQPIIS